MRRLSRTVGSRTVAVTPRVCRIVSAVASSAVAVTASTVGSPERLDRLAETSVRGPVSGSRHAHVVRLVDHEEADAAALGETARVQMQELRRGQHDVELAGREPRERVVAFARDSIRR